jgi:2'-hydroxyisoflavone reductase
MRILVLGGTSFVGRAVVTLAVDRGWSVTTFNRGLGPWAHPQAERVLGNRMRAADLTLLRDSQWDAVIDTWSGAPRAVRDSANLLTGQIGRYVYVSSRSVYEPPIPPGLDETHPVVPASSDADGAVGYAEAKRGAEIAVEAAFGDQAVLARTGLILGPHEPFGRLPWWLRRIETGGRVLAPGPAGLPMQYIDARDLAAWLLDVTQGSVSGPVNVVSRPGHTTMHGLLAAAIAATSSAAKLVWLDPATIEAAGLRPWSELPCWLPPDHELAGWMSTNVELAYSTGLRCRPVEQTVADTWAWMLATEQMTPAHDGQPPVGLDPAKERETLAAWHSRVSPA